MRRRDAIVAGVAGVAGALIAPATALAVPPYRPATLADNLNQMSAVLARVLDGSLELRHRPLAADLESGIRARLAGATDDEVWEAAWGRVHWYEAPFYLTDREQAAGATSSIQFQEATRALVNAARDRKITSLHSTRSHISNGVIVDDPWATSEARCGAAVARASVERRHLHHRWSLSLLGVSA